MDVMNYAKATVAVIGGVISWLIGTFGLACTILIGMMLLDYITGVCVAIKLKDVNSRTGLYGLFRKAYIIILIGAVYMVEKSILQTDGIATNGVIVAYIINEFISITENGGKLGVPLPGVLQNVIRVLQSKEEKSTEGEVKKDA